MRRIVALTLIVAGTAVGAAAADVEGVIVDWNCAKRMVQDGRQETLKRDRSCSLMRNYTRPAYGLITSDKKYYQFDDAGNRWARTLLKDSPNKDSLDVVVRGEVQGDTIQVKSMTEL
jgi:hypothetical protein